MHPPFPDTEARVAVLVDCDNVPPAILDHALQVAAPLGRVVLRRGYGAPAALAQRWQETLVRHAFAPCLQYPYAAGKNTADIALALDALEALLDGRARTFCIVSSDSDFSGLCRKLRERGATVWLVGEAKAPAALRHAGDRFLEWAPPARPQGTEPAAPAPAPPQPPAPNGVPGKPAPKATAAAAAAPAVKRRPRFVVDVVERLAREAPGGTVGLGALGQHLVRADPAFSPKQYGHTGLLAMLRSYDLLVTHEAQGGHWVGLAPAAEVPPQPAGDAAASDAAAHAAA